MESGSLPAELEASCSLCAVLSHGIFLLMCPQGDRDVFFTGNVLSSCRWDEGHRSQVSLLAAWDFCSCLALFLLLPDLVQRWDKLGSGFSFCSWVRGSQRATEDTSTTVFSHIEAFSCWEDAPPSLCCNSLLCAGQHPTLASAVLGPTWKVKERVWQLGQSSHKWISEE